MSDAVIQVSPTGATIVVEGSALLTGFVADADAAAIVAQAAANISETARDVAITAGPYYTSIALGESATTTGQEFAVATGDGTATWYRRTAGGSTEIFSFDYLGPVGTFGATLVANETAAEALEDLGIYDKITDNVSLADYCTPTTASAGFNAINAAFPNGVKVHIPRGTWLITTPVVFTGQRMNIYGDGQNVSILQFDPASASTALEFNATGAGGMYQGSIVGVGFYSTNTAAKTAIKCANCADFTISHIGIGSGNWQGALSKAIHWAGRQSLNLHSVQIACARPLVISKNPWVTNPTLNTDHCKFGGAGINELTTTETTGKCIEIEADVMATTCEFSNLALTNGKYGIYWSESGSAGASYGLVLNKIRREQSDDATGYSVYFDGPVQTVKLVDSYLDEDQGGIYLRRAQKVTIDNSIFAMTAGNAVDCSLSAGGTVLIQNSLFQSGSAVTISNAMNAFTARLGDSNPSQRGALEVWVYQDPADLNDPKTGAVLIDGITTSTDYVVADAGTLDIATNEFTGRIQIDSDVGTGAVYYLAGTNNVVSERDDPYGQYTPTIGNATTTNIYWNAGNSRYRLQNLTGVSKTYTILKVGRAV